MKGWVITDEPDWENDWDMPSRKGWGQHSEQDRPLEEVIPHRINVETDLNPGLIENPIRFRTMSDDGVEEGISYKGWISDEWLNSDETLAFAPLQFAQADVGDTIMEYRTSEGKWEML